MRIISSIVFIGLCLVAITYGQGAGGGRQKYDRYNNYDNSHSNFDDRDRYASSDHNNGRHRQRTYKTENSHSSLVYILIFLVVIAIIGCCICICGLVFFLTKRRRSDAGFDRVPTTETKTAQETTTVVSIPIKETEANDANLFPSGVWSGRYFQYDQWHGPSNFSLTFNPSSLTIDGRGSDDIGDFNVTGRYSTTTNEIELMKKYERGTGDESENFGHNVTIEVTWDNDKQLFLGNWYVNTESYRDEDRYELQFRNPVKIWLSCD